MKEITMPKQEIVKIINEVKVAGLKIEKYQKRPATFSKLPAITFKQIGDNIKRGFKNTPIQKETYGFQIDVYGDKSDDVSKIVQEVKKQMLLAGYHYLDGHDLDDDAVKFRFVMIFERRV